MTKARLSLIFLPLLVLAGSMAMLLAPGTAEAHALLVRSDPPQNGQQKVSPGNVTAYFSEALDTNLSTLQVLDGGGKRVDDGNTTFGPESVRMQIGIKDTLLPGYYTVVWQTLSAVDGHLFKGFYPFTMLNADGTQPAGQAYQGVSAGGTTAQPDTVSVRWARLLGIAALLGTLAFFSWVVSPSLDEIEEPWRTRWRDIARKRLLQVSLAAAAALAITALCELYLQAHQVGGLSYLSDVLKNDWGQRWIQRQIVLAGIVVALGVAYYLWKRGRRRLGDAAVWVALAGCLVYVVLLALVSHGDSVPGSFWAVGADFLHIVAASVWLGTLFQLALFLLWLRRDMPREAKTDLQASHLQRFSTIAATSVIVLLATGATNAAGQIPDWSSLYDTAYGRTLLVKLGIMCVLLLAAAANAFYLRPRLVDESDEGNPADDLRRRMTTAVRVELALGIAVLCAAAILVLYPTARQVRDAQAFEKASTSAVVGYEQRQPSADGNLLIDFTASPNSVGQNSFRVFLLPQSGAGIGNILKVRMKLAQHGVNQGQAFVTMDQAELPNAYKASGPYFSAAGRWDVDVVVERGGGLDDVTVTYAVVVAAPGAGQGQFMYPLTVGSWLSVAAASVLVLALIAATWVTEWPGRLPRLSPRFLRVGTAALTVLGAGILVISLIPGPANAGANPIKATAESISIGKNLYTQSCQQCHGINGKGDGPSAASLPVKPYDLNLHVPYHTDEYFFGVIKFGLGPIMPAWGANISDNDIWNLINFLHSEFGTNAQSSSGTPAPSAAGSSTPTPTPTPSVSPTSSLAQ
jgi:copper transport protein